MESKIRSCKLVKHKTKDAEFPIVAKQPVTVVQCLPSSPAVATRKSKRSEASINAGTRCVRSSCTQYNTKRLKGLEPGINLSDLDQATTDVHKTSKDPKKRGQRTKQQNGVEAIALICDRDVPTEALKLSAPTFCSKCYAKRFAYEPLFFCCRNGGVQLAENPWPP
ncbi:uncharacterized protein LOC110720288 isoform X2 [Chenopodium quinoa]|uniref:uncharacterized protein LOC110720288 isoform X2 n=1 Tax=Chenopodium quinoa TaxID=63459 RepID=UPI000B772DC4|nr:uncharacterized protein LOC110720288 isoform X2 [Chenopodium quinoa]